MINIGIPGSWFSPASVLLKDALYSLSVTAVTFCLSLSKVAFHLDSTAGQASVHCEGAISISNMGSHPGRRIVTFNMELSSVRLTITMTINILNKIINLSSIVIIISGGIYKIAGRRFSLVVTIGVRSHVYPHLPILSIYHNLRLPTILLFLLLLFEI